MTVTEARRTESDLMRLPADGRKVELVEGELREVPIGDRHDAIIALLIFLLYPFTRGRGMLCASQAGFRMKSGNVRAPDASFTRKERLPGGKAPLGFGDFAPDLCIEVISPSEEQEEMQRKVEEYFAAGAEQVWHLFAETQTVTVFSAPTQSRTFGPTDTLSGGALLPGFASLVADLFALEEE